MSFTGELEHLPIVDVIQLLNSSRKSGLLTVKGRKGESQLVFKDGYIVSASHLNNSVRIGKLLVDTGKISQEQLEQGLKKQQLDGAARKPLAITLIVYLPEIGTNTLKWTAVCEVGPCIQPLPEKAPKSG